VSRKKKSHDIELSPEDFEKLIVDLEDFDTKGLVYLAKTDNFEIIPTTDEEGKVISRESLNYLKREVEKLGYSIIYRIDKVNGEVVLIDSHTLKTMVLIEGMQ
jgi:hypothetical protein